MNLICKIKEFRLQSYEAMYRCLPIKRNKIVMWANSFKHYGCSPKYLTEYIVKNRPGEYDIVWVFDRAVAIPNDIPAGVRVVRYFSLEYLNEIHSAHYIICNMRTGASYRWKKRKGQYYIQTWHSSIRLKKIEKDAGTGLPVEYIEAAKQDSARIDLIVSGCEFSSNIFRNSFWYDGEILNSGTPRCDIFFSGNQEQARLKVFESLSLAPSKKMVLYAPTFRNNKAADLHGLNFQQIKQALKHKTGEEWEVLYRFHPNIIQLAQSATDGIDVSRYSDMQELIAAADLLITDYSSCMFDMAIAHKPCLLFAPDINDYVSNERGLYFKPDELPFPLVTDNEGVVDAILQFDKNRYHEALEQFLVSVGSYENGDASQKIINYLEQRIKNDT